MSNQEIEQKSDNQENKESSVQPEPETLHTPDPPKKMEGPVSTLMQKIKEGFDPEISKADADKERDESL